ncbi:unnamed protein product [Paramecium sonneborni]|uniref:Uncharacterized protein n=1 Tax=Paramecium sonneborni TaxID=65129 RepID=A0A8S1QZB7_9CILI|nr:unnamed protein product [Paramecium sonneborni]
MLIIAFIGIALSQEVFWSNYSFQSPEYINLIAQQTNFARSFEEFGQILNFTIEYDSNQNKDQCSFEYQYLIFNQMYNVFGNLVNDLQLVEIDELETIQIEQGFQNQIVSYTKSDLTLLLLDRNGSIHYLNFDEGSLLFNYSKLNLTYYSQTKQHQQLLNDKETFYYVNNEQFSKFIIQNNQLYQFEILNWNQQYGTFKIQIRNNYVYTTVIFKLLYQNQYCNQNNNYFKITIFIIIYLGIRTQNKLIIHIIFFLCIINF